MKEKKERIIKRTSLRGRGIADDPNDVFVKQFKDSDFYKKIYCKHKDEIIIGIRDGFINLYYNCDSIAKIDCMTKQLKGEISGYYIDRKGKPRISADVLVSQYESIKMKSDVHEYSTNGGGTKNKNEKKAQSKLYIDNNRNNNSKWFCIDIEYEKAIEGNATPEKWRFDLVAISRQKPYRVALIELKYGSAAIGGDNGIRKHIIDFHAFHKNRENFYEKMLKPELVSIIQGLNKVGVILPEGMDTINENEFAKEPEYYFITLDNNKDSERGSSPEMTMDGYLFDDNPQKPKEQWIWDCGNRRTSQDVIKGNPKKGTEAKDYFGLIENDETFKPVFLFSKKTLPNIGIDDILDPNCPLPPKFEQ